MCHCSDFCKPYRSAWRVYHVVYERFVWATLLMWNHNALVQNMYQYTRRVHTFRTEWLCNFPVKLSTKFVQVNKYKFQYELFQRTPIYVYTYTCTVFALHVSHPIDPLHINIHVPGIPFFMAPLYSHQKYCILFNTCTCTCIYCSYLTVIAISAFFQLRTRVGAKVLSLPCPFKYQGRTCIDFTVFIFCWKDRMKKVENNMELL